MRRRIVEAYVAAMLGIIAACAAPAAMAGTPGTVHPGVQTFTEGGQCTANFIFSDAQGTYIGQAAHCAGLGAATDVNGCSAGSLPLGTEVSVTGAGKPGELAYSSWLTMQAVGETDPNACEYNDFALVKLDPSDVDKVDPSVPGFGGPTGVGGAGVGATVSSFGNSSLRDGLTLLGPKQGLVISVDGGGWSRTVLTVTPGIPGDSGSGFLNDSGQAVGVLSTLSLTPIPLTNGVGDLSRELSYMRAHSSFTDADLMRGTKPFQGGLLDAIVDGPVSSGLSDLLGGQ